MVVNALHFIKRNIGVFLLVCFFRFFLWTVLLFSYHILIIFVPPFSVSKWLSNSVEDEIMTQQFLFYPSII